VDGLCCLRVLSGKVAYLHRIEAISRDARVMAVGKLLLFEFLSGKLLIGVGGGSEEIMSELAIREEVKDLRLYAKSTSKL
jgi:hypothetical protein